VISSSDDLEWVAYIAGSAFLSTILASCYLAAARPEKAWYDGRATAESAKSLAWEYAVGGGPFCVETCPNADDLLLSRLSDLVTKLRDFAVDFQADASEQISAAMQKLRTSSLEDRRNAYLSGRIDDQRTWYVAKARWNERRNHTWLIVSLASQGAGVVGAFLLGAGVINVNALGVLAAVAASAAGWVQAKDHASLSRAYKIAAQELGLARARLVSETDEVTWANLVDDAEQAISREHTLWLARRGSATQQAP